MSAPRLNPPPAPAECLKSAFESFAPGLTGLPTNFRQLDPDGRARALLTNKADDGQNYQLLRAQAIRCAPVR